MDVYIMWLSLEPGDPKVPILFNDLRGTRQIISPARAEELIADGIPEVK